MNPDPAVACAHPSTRQLTPEIVSRKFGAYLHRMLWAEDEETCEIPNSWNWLEGWNEIPAAGTPNAVHFTRGGPYFEGCRDVGYARELTAEADAYKEAPAVGNRRSLMNRTIGYNVRMRSSNRDIICA